MMMNQSKFDGLDTRAVRSDHSKELWSGAHFLLAKWLSRYSMRGDVAILQEKDLDDATRVTQLDEMVERARRTNCLSAASETYGPQSNMIRYITDQTRHVYLSLLPVNHDARVLEIGCALGQCTSLLAKQVGEVVAIDVVRGQAEFTSLRCKEQGLSNVHVAVTGEDGWLPFRSESFDVVVFNLVFEWCGSRSPEGNAEIQQRMLSEIARVTKRGGVAWISTKNRYSLRLLLGDHDEHLAGIRFGSVLPRRIGQWILNRQGIATSRGLLHSNGCLHSMIRQSGFSTVEAYWAVPEPRYVEKCIKADIPSIRAFRSTYTGRQAHGRWISKLMAIIPAKFVPHIAAGNCYVARK